MKQVLVVTVLSLSLLFDVSPIKDAPETIGEIPNFVNNRPLEEISFVPMLEKLQHIEAFLPYARKEQAVRCPSLLRRLISRQTDEEKTLCKEVQQVVTTLQTAQECLKYGLRYEFEFKRCGNDKDCQDKVKEKLEKYFDVLKQKSEKEADKLKIDEKV